MRQFWDIGLSYALLAIAFWATVASAFKIALRYQNPMTLVLISVTVSFLVLAIVLIFSPLKSHIKKLTLKEWTLFALLGFLNPFLYYQILFVAYDLLPAQMAQVINFTWPVFIVLTTLLLGREPFAWGKLLAIGVSFLGAVIVITHGQFHHIQVESWKGVTLALVSALVWTAFWMINKEQKRDPLLALTITFFFGMVFSVLAAVTVWHVQIPDMAAMLSGTYVGVFEMSLTFLFWLSALKKAHSISLVNNLIYVTPFLSLMTIRLVLKEAIYPATLAGLLVIVSGIVLQFYQQRKRA